MSHEPLTLEPLNYPKPHNVVGIDITVLVSREATGGHEITLQTAGTTQATGRAEAHRNPRPLRSEGSFIARKATHGYWMTLVGIESVSISLLEI